MCVRVTDEECKLCDSDCNSNQREKQDSKVLPKRPPKRDDKPSVPAVVTRESLCPTHTQTDSDNGKTMSIAGDAVLPDLSSLFQETMVTMALPWLPASRTASDSGGTEGRQVERERTKAFTSAARLSFSSLIQGLSVSSAFPLSAYHSKGTSGAQARLALLLIWRRRKRMPASVNQPVIRSSVTRKATGRAEQLEQD